MPTRRPRIPPMPAIPPLRFSNVSSSSVDEVLITAGCIDADLLAVRRTLGRSNRPHGEPADVHHAMRVMSTETRCENALDGVLHKILDKHFAEDDSSVAWRHLGALSGGPMPLGPKACIVVLAHDTRRYKHSLFDAPSPIGPPRSGISGVRGPALLRCIRVVAHIHPPKTGVCCVHYVASRCRVRA